MNAPPRQARTAPAHPLRRVDELVVAGLIAAEDAEAAGQAAERFPVRLTPDLLAAVRPDTPDDPVARQFVPSAGELIPHPNDVADPIGDAACTTLEGLVHRHPDRVLLKPTDTCPVHCRFCFRRGKVGRSGALAPEALAAALDYLRIHEEVREVVLTGGDPLMLSAERLARLMMELADIPHLQILRIHSRVPVADPTRLDSAMLATLRASPLPLFVVIHCNHPNELGGGARRALESLVDGGIPVLSQTVLLSGVNDDAGTLAHLFGELLRLRVKPYYLHHGDLVPGAAHFRVPLERGREIVADVRVRVSGLAMPTYILDIPGGAGKVPAEGAYLADDCGSVRDPAGTVHSYPK